MTMHNPHASYIAFDDGIRDTFVYEDLAVSGLEILPYHGQGFIFKWHLNDDFSAPPPFTFRVQMAPTQAGPWYDISGPIVDSMCWADTRRPVGKTESRNYRVTLVDGSGKRYASEPKLPCGDLSLREFLIAREILRKEELNARKFAGVIGQVWIEAEYGFRCLKCIDPITKQVRNSHCPFCHGTGRYPSHYGPFEMWLQFSAKQNHGASHDDAGGTKDDKPFSVRAVGTPRLKKNDVLRDPSTGKMYYINAVTNAAEIRRIPVVQQLTVSEAATTDQCYDLPRRPDPHAE